MASEVLETRLSFGDEQAGRVVLRGRDLAALAASATYEAVIAVLWRDVVPAALTGDALGHGRLAAYQSLAPLLPALRGHSAAETMKMLVAAFPPDAADTPVAAVAHVGIAASLAIGAPRGGAPLPPDPRAGHIADLLAMATGKPPTAVAAAAFERYCILMIDHGINASTFAARIAASTGASTGDAMLAALAVLQGPRHGGAPSFVLDQLDAIGSVANVARFVHDRRAAGGRIFGFGSRAYKGRDVRAELLRTEWRAASGGGSRGDAEAIEQALTAELAKVAPERGLRANVEYYAALLMEAVGIPRWGMTPMFAMARSAGWVAHIAEQRERNRIIRPESRYTGAAIDPAIPRS